MPRPRSVAEWGKPVLRAECLNERCRSLRAPRATSSEEALDVRVEVRLTGVFDTQQLRTVDRLRLVPSGYYEHGYRRVTATGFLDDVKTGAGGQVDVGDEPTTEVFEGSDAGRYACGDPCDPTV